MTTLTTIHADRASPPALRPVFGSPTDMQQVTYGPVTSWHEAKRELYWLAGAIWRIEGTKPYDQHHATALIRRANVLVAEMTGECWYEDTQDRDAT